jgi:hypothetical protein
MKKIFLTFASSDLKQSLSRIEKQAQALDFYDQLYFYTEHDLSPEFFDRFRQHLQIGSRGYGYWCWKPQILLQLLDKMNEGDVIQYTDAGCHLNIKGIERLTDYFNLAKNAKNGILAFQAGTPGSELQCDQRQFPLFPDEEWIKGDLLDYFGVRDNKEVVTTPTIGAGIIFIRKCPQSLQLIQEWLEVIEADFHFIDDTPSRSPNMSVFREHRHDQAIFSLLCKKHGVVKLSCFEYWYPSKNNSLKPDWSTLDKFPIHAKRDKDMGVIRNLILLSTRILNKIKKIHI